MLSLQVWSWSLPPVEVETGEGSPLGEPGTFDFKISVCPGRTCLRGPHQHLHSPSRNSGSSSSRCAKLPLSRRARHLAATSAPSAGAPCAPRSSASWASWCVPRCKPHACSASRPQQHLLMASLSLVSLLMLLGHHAVPPSAPSVLPNSKCCRAAGTQKANPMAALGGLCCLDKKAAVQNCILLCPPRTTATQRRTSAVPRQDCSPSTTWCISPGTPPTPIAGCVHSPRELPGREVLVDLHLLFLSL